MKKMFILISHDMTVAQYEDAKMNFAIDDFIIISTHNWSQIPAEIDNISSYLENIKHNLIMESNAGDILLVQGDFGATVEMAQFAFKQGLIPIYATTKRIAKEIVDGDKITTIRVFEHVRFRKYYKDEIWQKY